MKIKLYSNVYQCGVANPHSGRDCLFCWHDRCEECPNCWTWTALTEWIFSLGFRRRQTRRRDGTILEDWESEEDIFRWQREFEDRKVWKGTLGEDKLDGNERIHLLNNKTYYQIQFSRIASILGFYSRNSPILNISFSLEYFVNATSLQWSQLQVFPAIRWLSSEAVIY